MNHAPLLLRIAIAYAGLVVLSLATGCGPDAFDWIKPKVKPPPEAPPPAAADTGPYLADTIGARTLLSSVQPVVIRGFGVVIGLGTDGGRDCPTAIRDYLIDFFQREYAPDGSSGGRPRIVPGKLLDSVDSAVVQLTAVVPPGAARGARLDLQVESMDSETRSLEGGVLLPCELKVFDQSATGRGVLAGRTLARGQGPVFTNPFRGDSSPSEARRGIVLGGGALLEERTARLVLNDPAYAIARQIQDRINERFGQSPAVAEAMSMGYVQLRTPRTFAERPARFLESVGHLFIENSPEYVRRRLDDLAEQVRASPDSARLVSLAWEGIGRTAVAAIQPLYADADDSVRYYAARAGVRLGDPAAIPILASFAARDDDSLRMDAVRELGESGSTQAALRLADLLSESDPGIRIAAYEALRRMRHPAIAGRAYACPLDATQPNLLLDVIDCGGPALIYVRRSREPRIAVFGKDIPVRVPVFYSHAREWLTLNALKDADLITMYCRTRRSGVLSDSLFIPPRVIDVIHRMASLPVKDDSGQFQGLGLHYALIVEAIQSLCDNGLIPATLILEESAISDVLGPAQSPERPEADLPPPEPETPEETP